ncbi:MAG: peptidylprolyl isomerase [Lactobacillaceae bacterium]|jgi:peptidyl-prolyl cis-trans isomerase C|nr:peptidylprolyl isomerase [Lactobacillaceae bacterium]
MQKKYVALAVLGLVLTTGNAKAEGKDGAAAVVNGDKITVQEIKDGYNENQQIKSQVSFEDFYDKGLEIFVNAKLVLQAAEKEKVRNTDEYKKQIKVLGDELARRVYLDKAVTKKVTNEEVQKLYKQYKDKFESKKEVKAKHILVDDEAKAKDIIAKLKKGEKFDDLAKEFSKDQPDLGYFTQEMMVKEFGDAAFSMKKGTHSQSPVKTQFGYHVILVEDSRDTKPLTIQEAEPQLKAMLSQAAVGSVIEDLRKEGKVEEYSLDGKTK